MFLPGSGLIQVSGQWALQDTTVDMRMGVNDLLAAFAQAPDNSAPGEITCQNKGAYISVLQALCPVVDIASSPGPPSAPCDALSVAAVFQAKQALLGDVRPPSPPPAPCAPGINPATDSCELAGD